MKGGGDDRRGKGGRERVEKEEGGGVKREGERVERGGEGG